MRSLNVRIDRDEALPLPVGSQGWRDGIVVATDGQTKLLISKEINQQRINQ